MGDKGMYFRYMRITPSKREYLLSLVAPFIAKLHTNYRQSIPPEQRLSLTLRHLATRKSRIFCKFAVSNWTPDGVANHSRNLQSYL